MKCINLLLCVKVFLLMISCAKPQDNDCILLEKPIELTFSDTNLQDIRFYPFEKGKIWVRTHSKNGDIWVIDKLTGEKNILDKNKSPYFTRYSHQDQYDSLVWIGGSNRNVMYYDQRLKVFQTLPVHYVTRIISKPDAVFFVSLQGFCYWDRKSKAIHQVEGLPNTFFQSSVMPDDSTVILDGKYTYFFASKQVKEVAFIYGYEHKGDWCSYKASNGCGLFYKDDSLYYIYQGTVKKLPIRYNNIDGTRIINQKYWQSDASFFYSFDPALNEIKKYGFRLPAVNNYATNYEIDSRYIWITRPGQLMLVRLADNQQFDFPIVPGDGYVRTIFDECNVYILYKNKIMLCSKEDFIKKCTKFDAKQYDQEIHAFEAVVDSLGVYKDTLPSVSLVKLNYLKSRYSDTKNIEVSKKLYRMNTTAFHSNIYKFPDGYKTCYKDNSIPNERRIYCMKCLVDEYAKLSDFDKLMYLKKEFVKYFGSPKHIDEHYFIREIDSVETYLTNIDRLQVTISAEDSLYYLKSIALESICQTDWHCYEGCGGCDFSLVTKRLERFKVKFPGSALIDNCTHYLINDKYRYHMDDPGLLESQNRDYETFLKNFPDSDVTAEVQFSIFNNWVSMGDEYKSKIKTTGQRFIRTFGTDKRVAEVKEQLKYLSKTQNAPTNNINQ